MQAPIFNIQRYSLNDGGGIRTIVFFKGCPFHCPWCSNPESLQKEPQIIYHDALCINCSEKQDGVCHVAPELCPTNAQQRIGEMKSIKDVFDIIQRDIIFYETSGGGVTLSGGECLWHEDFAINLLKRCKQENIHTAIETTLAIPIKKIEELVKYTDTFLIDFKVMNEKKSKELIGISIKQLKENMESILRLNGKIIPRIPLIPNFTTTSDNIAEIIAYLKEKKLKEIHLLPFHKLGEAKYEGLQMEYYLHDLKPLSDQDVQDIEKLFQENGFHTVIGGN